MSIHVKSISGRTDALEVRCGLWTDMRAEGYLTPDVYGLRLWDNARDYGLPGVRALMINLRIPHDSKATFVATS